MIVRSQVILIFLLAFFQQAQAQYFQFSQHNMVPQRVNPAMVASSNFASADFLYRNQSTGGGFHLTSNLLSVAYPLINKRGVRWSGFGLSFMDDRAGSGIYSTQEASFSYALNIPLSKFESLSMGVRVLRMQRNIDLSGLFTGLQYIPDRGFDGGMSTGENFDGLRNSIVTFSSGLYWQRVDKKGNHVASAGLSLFDFNKPDDAFLEGSHGYPSALVFSGSVRMFTRTKVSVYPEVLYTVNAAKSRVIAGFITSYEINSYRNRPSDKIDLITKYAPGRAAILGLQFQRSDFTFGLSYDFPLFTEDVDNAGALELSVEWRKLVDPRQRQKKRNAKDIARRKSNREKTAIDRSDRKSGFSKEVTSLKSEEATSLKKDTLVNNAGRDLSHRLKEKQDSVMALGRAGDIIHEPLILEEATLRFGFDFNSAALDESSSLYLDDLAAALIDNPRLSVELTGHTDNIGSAKFNQRLSLNRAQYLKEQLMERGVEVERIRVSGKGFSEPLNDNSTPEKRAENRRVEMKIVYAD